MLLEKKTFIFPLQMKIHLISVELELESITCDYKKLSKKYANNVHVAFYKNGGEKKFNNFNRLSS